MKKSTLIPILVVTTLAVVAGASIGFYYLFSPSDDSIVTVVSATAQDDGDTVNLTLTCEANESGNMHRNRFRRNFAYMHKLQIKNASSGESLVDQQFTYRWRHRVESGHLYRYQYHIEGLEHGQVLQLRIEYNNGKVLTHTFIVGN